MDSMKEPRERAGGRRLSPATVKRLLVRGPNWIGDAVMSEPALAALRSVFPEAEVTLLVKPPVAELFTGHPAVDRILVYEDRGKHAGLGGKWILADELRRRRFDLAVLFQNAFEAALLSFMAGIPRRYGYATDGRGWLLSDPVEKNQTKRHQVSYYLDLLKPLGAPAINALPRLFLTAEEERAMDGRLAGWGLGAGDVLIGLNPGSTYGGAKRWLPERFAEVSNRLADDLAGRGHKVHVAIIGAKGEEELGRAIAGGITAQTMVLSGQTTIRELMAVVKRCRLFLTNDTGPMHVAAAFGVPVVAVFGPTDHRTTSPAGPDHVIVREPVECAPCLLRECPIDHRCMTRVTADRVYAAAAGLVTRPAAEDGLPTEARADRPATVSTRPMPLAGVTVFLDRDGTLNRDTGYVKTTEEFQLLPGVVEALVRLKQAGARLVVVTNQSGVARGLIGVEALKAIHARLLRSVEASGGALDAIYFCPHHPKDDCLCRKPRPGMVEKAAADLGLDLSACYMVGDQSRDVELGRRIGARTVLLTAGPASQDVEAMLKEDARRPDHVAAGLPEAADWILSDAEGSRSPHHRLEAGVDGRG